nr:hypothetical protein [Providencia rettgeri]
MDIKNRYVYFEKEQTIFRKFNNGQTKKFNPCNNPADAMPIIIENGININFNVCHHDKDKVSAFKSIEIYSITKNIYRAAMEVYLLMKDAENNQ